MMEILHNTQAAWGGSGLTNRSRHTDKTLLRRERALHSLHALDFVTDGKEVEVCVLECVHFIEGAVIRVSGFVLPYYQVLPLALIPESQDLRWYHW